MTLLPVTFGLENILFQTQVLMTLLPVKPKFLLAHNWTKPCTWLVYEVMTLLPVDVRTWPGCKSGLLKMTIDGGWAQILAHHLYEGILPIFQYFFRFGSKWQENGGPASPNL